MNDSSPLRIPHNNDHQHRPSDLEKAENRDVVPITVRDSNGFQTRSKRNGRNDHSNAPLTLEQTPSEQQQQQQARRKMVLQQNVPCCHGIEPTGKKRGPMHCKRPSLRHGTNNMEKPLDKELMPMLRGANRLTLDGRFCPDCGGDVLARNNVNTKRFLYWCLFQPCCKKEACQCSKTRENSDVSLRRKDKTTVEATAAAVGAVSSTTLVTVLDDDDYISSSNNTLITAATSSPNNIVNSSSQQEPNRTSSAKCKESTHSRSLASLEHSTASSSTQQKESSSCSKRTMRRRNSAFYHPQVHSEDACLISSSSSTMSDLIPSTDDAVGCYKGPFNQYGERQGEGELVWPNGDRYVGTFWNGVREGHGSIVFANGGSYVGWWENDKMHGSGTRTYAPSSSGGQDVYTGQFHEGLREGQGRFEFANGDLYNGGWYNDQPNGLGEYCYKNQNSFEGFFHNGVRQGLGKFRFADGRFDIQRYYNDVRVGEGVRISPGRSSTAWRLMGSKVMGPVSQEEATVIAQGCDCNLLK